MCECSHLSNFVSKVPGGVFWLEIEFESISTVFSRDILISTIHEKTIIFSYQSLWSLFVKFICFEYVSINTNLRMLHQNSFQIHNCAIFVTERFESFAQYLYLEFVSLAHMNQIYWCLIPYILRLQNVSIDLHLEVVLQTIKNAFDFNIWICKITDDKIDQSTNLAKLLSAKWLFWVKV